MANNNVINRPNVSFCYHIPAPVANVTGNSTLYSLGQSNTKSVDFVNNCTVNLGGLFYAPVTGYYWLASAVTFTDITAAMTAVEIRIQASPQTSFGQPCNPSLLSQIGLNNTFSVQVSGLFYIAAGQYSQVILRIAGGAGDTATLFGDASLSTYFCGYLVSE